MKTRGLGFVIALALLAPGCQGSGGNGDGGSAETVSSGASGGQTPMAAARDMLALAEAGDWANYVDRFYGEAHKFSSPADRDALVARFEEEWGFKVTEALQEASSIVPVVDGDRAEFRDGEGVVLVLYRNDAGAWTFHL